MGAIFVWVVPVLIKEIGKSAFGFDAFVMENFSTILLGAMIIIIVVGPGLPEDLDLWKAYAIAHPDRRWIYKPNGGARGRGSKSVHCRSQLASCWLEGGIPKKAKQKAFVLSFFYCPAPKSQKLTRKDSMDLCGFYIFLKKI